MSKVLVTESHLNNIAEAIRLKNGASTTYRPGDMAAAIQSLDTSGIHPEGTKQITQNGTHDVTEFASANVYVQPNLQSKTTTQNGTVTPDQGYDGLSSVEVNVSGGGGDQPFYILKSDDLSAAYNAANKQSSMIGNYVAKTQNNQATPSFQNGYITRIGYEVGGWKHITKIKAGDYTKLCVDVTCSQYGTGWRNVYLCLCSSLNLQTNGQLPDQIRSVYLAGQAMTAEQINAQSGVTINSTNQYALERQIVELDISEVTTDFYVGFWNCDMYVSVYNIYLQ